MRVAALYDVHGNLPALEAVLADVRSERPDVLLFGGDIVSGPLPKQTLELVRSLEGAVFIRGNADVLSTPRPNPEIDAGVRWVEAQLGEGEIRWLSELPFSWSADDALYVHANPRDIEAPFHEWTPEDELREWGQDVAETSIVTGHVHMQWDRTVDGKRWIGAGSVGMPYEETPGAYWALLDDGRLDFRRTDYDLESAAAVVLASGHPQADEFASENVLRVPSRAEARAAFGF